MAVITLTFAQASGADTTGMLRTHAGLLKIVDQNEAMDWKLRYNAKWHDDPVVQSLAEYAVPKAIEDERFRASGASRMLKSKIDAVLAIVRSDCWTSEASIAEAISLTPFEWRALEADLWFRSAPRKTGRAYRLTKDGERERDRRQMERRWKAELARMEAAREARLEAHERLMPLAMRVGLGPDELDKSASISASSVEDAK